uniref:Pentatricopeptide repeat-containing protein n=1 Tax=Aegilops tauschii TaxID=37682 RepID=M8ATX5_AEGTA
MPARTASTYNTLISHAPAGTDLRSLARRMIADGLCPDRFTVSALLSACASERDGRELHCFAVKRRMCGDGDFHVSSGFVSMYCRVSRPGLARWVFDRMQQRNVVSWTAMVGGYAENGMFEDAVKAFRAMWVVDGILPNRVALISVLSAVEGLMGLAEGKQVHGFAVRMGLYGEVSLNNALVDMYAKGGALRHARRIFDDGTWHKDVISWGSMVLGYGLHGMGTEAVALFDQMHASGVKPDSIVGLGVLSACCRAGMVLKGLEIYNSLVKDHKVHPTVEMSACVVDLLGRSGLIDHALDFIKSMSIEPGPSVWGALLDASVIHSNKETQDLACSGSELYQRTQTGYALESLALYSTTSAQIVPLAVKRAELLYFLYSHTCTFRRWLLQQTKCLCNNGVVVCNVHSTHVLLHQIKSLYGGSFLVASSTGASVARKLNPSEGRMRISDFYPESLVKSDAKLDSIIFFFSTSVLLIYVLGLVLHMFVLDPVVPKHTWHFGLSTSVEGTASTCCARYRSRGECRLIGQQEFNPELLGHKIYSKILDKNNKFYYR